MSAAPSAVLPTVPASPPEASGLRDFSDRLSPMLVKELRQGLRSPVFVWGLIGMNLCMAMVVWLTMEDSGSETLNQAFFGAYCVVVCGLLPLRAANALHEELKGNTIDTLVLTRLSGWRITLGKWVAVAAQQTLTMVTVLPYLIVRYFAGGLNVPLELAWLGVFLLLGLLSAAVLTGFSWLKYFLLRAAIMLGVTAAVGSFCAAVLDEMYGYRNEYILDEIHQELGWRFFAMVLVAVLHMMFFTLDIGAAQVSSLAENRSTLRRLLGLAAIVIYIGLEMWEYFGNSRYSLSWEMDFSGMGGFMAFITALVLIPQALVEQPLNIPPVLRPFTRRGVRGRLMGRLFYPGWPSGVLFSFYLLLPLGVGGWMRCTGAGSLFLICREAAFLLTLPVPLVLYRWFFSGRAEWRFGVYLFIFSTLGAWTILLLALSRAVESPVFLIPGLPMPLSGWAWASYFHSAGGYNLWAESVVLATLVTGAFWWVMALRLALRAFRETDAGEDRLMAEPSAACVDTPAPGHSEKTAEIIR